MQKILNISAVVIIILIIISIFSIKHFSAKKANIYGPSMMASSSHLLAIDTGKTLYIFDKEGNTVARKTYQELNIPPEVSKMQLLDNTLYLAMSDDGSLYSCDLISWKCEILPGFSNVARGSFGFAITEEYIYITDTSRHTFKTFDKNGTLIADSRGTPVPLCYPNQLSLIDGELYVADTNNHRLALIDITNPAKVEINTTVAVTGNNKVWEVIMSARNLPNWCAPISDKIFGENGDAYFERALDFNEKMRPSAPDLARKGSVWPTAFAYDANKNWWILIGGNNLRNSDVLIYQDGKAIKRINENMEKFDPVDIKLFQQDMLVSDFASMQVLKFSESGNWMGEFGELDFQHDMRDLKKLKDKYSLYATVSQEMIYFLVFIVIIIAVLDKINRK